jgi:uncharacterized DUF497 family protein
MGLRIENIVWQEHIIDKIMSKHAMDPEEVESALFNLDVRPHFYKKGDDRYLVYCRSENTGAYIFAVIAMREPKTATVITARPMTDSEKTAYRKIRGL